MKIVAIALGLAALSVGPAYAECHTEGYVTTCDDGMGPTIAPTTQTPDYRTRGPDGPIYHYGNDCRGRLPDGYNGC